MSVWPACSRSISIVKSTVFMAGLHIVPLDRRFMAVSGACLAAVFREEAEALRNRHELRQRSYLCLLHHLVAVRLDGSFRRPQLMRDLLVDLASNDEVEDLPLARCQFRDV